MQTLVSDFLLSTFRALTTDMSCEHARSQLQLARVQYLPVVNLGILTSIFEGEKTASFAPNTTLAEAATPLADADITLLSPHQSVFEAANILAMQNAEVAFVTEENGEYCGAVMAADIFAAIAHLVGATDEGAVISVELSAIDFSLTRIVNIIEECGVKILSISTDRSEAYKISVIVKLNVADCYTVEQSLERYGFTVYRLTPLAASPSADISTESRNYAELMRYLNI